MELDLFPGDRFERQGGQRLQGRLLNGGKALQRFLFRGAMDAWAGDLMDPLAHIRIRLVQVMMWGGIVAPG